MKVIENYLKEDISPFVVPTMAALIVLSYNLFYSVFSLKAKTCRAAYDRWEAEGKGKFKGEKKRTMCYLKLYEEGAKRAISMLKQKRTQCKKTSNPEKCQAKIDKLISKWEVKAAKANAKKANKAANIALKKKAS
tara:strand:+ start:1841 stop:2245 length:405 start_codon:yes stop_codon:yes gene_type:complete